MYLVIMLLYVICYTAMIDSGLGPVRINNLLTTLNIQPIKNKNLKHMENRAGTAICEVADESCDMAAIQAYSQEMK